MEGHRISFFGTPMTSLQISVIIPTYNRPTALRNLLLALNAQTVRPDAFEVIVVDDGSPEPVVIRPAEHPYRVQLFRQENTGPAGARNTALQHVEAPLTLILNDDAVPCKNLIAEHLTAHATCPEKRAVLGSFPFTDEVLDTPFMRVLECTNLLFPHLLLKDGATVGPGFFWTCNISLSTKALHGVGGFDAETFRDAIVEDVELGHRLADRGWKVLYRANARCEHDHRISPAAYRRRAVKMGRNMVKFGLKHGMEKLEKKPQESLQDFFHAKRLQYLQLKGRRDAMFEAICMIEQRGNRTQPDLKDLNTLASATWWVNWTSYLEGMVEELESHLNSGAGAQLSSSSIAQPSKAPTALRIPQFC